MRREKAFETIISKAWYEYFLRYSTDREMSEILRLSSRAFDQVALDYN